VYRLGGQQLGEVVAVPMIVGCGVAVIFFYGETVPDARPIGPLDTLEFMIGEAALATERTLVATRGEVAGREATEAGPGTGLRDCKFFLTLILP
jgi:hypothetical protein